MNAERPDEPFGRLSRGGEYGKSIQTEGRRFVVSGEAFVGRGDDVLQRRLGRDDPVSRGKVGKWYSAWVEAPESRRYYRYLYETDIRAFVGEIAYHYDEERKIYLCDVIVLAEYRNRGFGAAGIGLLCKAAKENGIAALHDDIAAGNPAYKLFLKNGFAIEHQNDDVVMVRKKL